MSLRRSKLPKTPDAAATAKGSLPPEALEFESPSAAIIATRIPPLSRSINFLVFLLVLATLTAASLIQIDKIVSGQGKLVADAPNIVLQPFDQSIVESIDVRKGDLVEAGQVLARLNPTFSAADLAALEDQVDSLRATAERLEAEIAGGTYPPDVPASFESHAASIAETGTVTGDERSPGASLPPVVTGHEAEAADMSYSAEQLGPLPDVVRELPLASRFNAAIGYGAADFFGAASAQGMELPQEGRVRPVMTADNPLAAEVELAKSEPVDILQQANPHVQLQALFFKQRSREYLSTLEHYDQNINQLQLQIAGSEAQAKHFGERADLANQVQGIRQALVERGADNRMNMLIAIDTRLTIDGLHAEAQSAAAQAGRQMAAQVAERESFIQRWAVQNLRELVETRRNLVQAEQSYSKARLHHDLIVLTAPRDSVILSVATVSAGSVVTSAEPLIHLVPLDVPLSVEVDIAGMDSGYVREGDEVTIKFDTLPYLQYGMARGLVRSISADSFNPEAMLQNNDASLPTRPSMLYYKGYIAIDQFELFNPPPGFRLVPGMPVTVDVKVGTRSILAYFFGRILPVVYESIREP